MDENRENLQAKLSQLAEQLNNNNPSVDEAREIKTVMEDILKRLDALQYSIKS